jgi:hypothetical protein
MSVDRIIVENTKKLSHINPPLMSQSLKKHSLAKHDRARDTLRSGLGSFANGRGPKEFAQQASPLWSFPRSS